MNLQEFGCSPFLPSPQTVSDGAVCLCKFHCLLHNILIINVDKFLQRGRVLTAKNGISEASNLEINLLRHLFMVPFLCLKRNESEYKLVMWTFYAITGIK